VHEQVLKCSSSMALKHTQGHAWTSCVLCVIKMLIGNGKHFFLIEGSVA